jgi:hypothetical protein
MKLKADKKKNSKIYVEYSDNIIIYNNLMEYNFQYNNCVISMWKNKMIILLDQSTTIATPADDATIFITF